MTVALTTNKTKKFSRPQDVGNPAAPVFTIRTLSARQRAAVMDEMTDPSTGRPRPGSFMFAAVQYGVSNIENLQNDAGEVVIPEFINGVLADVTLDQIAPFIPELAAQVLELNQLTPNDLGN